MPNQRRVKKKVTLKDKQQKFAENRKQADQQLEAKLSPRYNFKKIAIPLAILGLIFVLLCRTFYLQIFEQNQIKEAELEELQNQLETEIQKNTELTSIDNLMQYQNGMEIRENIYSLEQPTDEQQTNN